MKICIDASNIRLGGGITHLSRLLTAFRPGMGGVHEIEVWSGHATLKDLPQGEGICHLTDAALDASLLQRARWQQHSLPKLLKKRNVALLFSPGGTLPRKSPVPTVTISQNMLPFEPLEARLFGRLHPMTLKMALLRRVQGRSFIQADGLIFLSNYARSRLTALLNIAPTRTVLIPHGIESRFMSPPRLERVQNSGPHRLLYVSILMPYKHQLEVAEAVMSARRAGIDVSIDFIGPSSGGYGQRVKRRFAELDPGGEIVRWRGSVPFEKMHDIYAQADAFIFASSCENLPNILIEAMANGLPIASSDRGPMPEVLEKAGIYFDPYSKDSIERAIVELVRHPEAAFERAKQAYVIAQKYSWNRCAEDTFSFLGEIATKSVT